MRSCYSEHERAALVLFCRCDFCCIYFFVTFFFFFIAMIFGSLIAGQTSSRIVVSFGHFFCSTAPQAFFRPDRIPLRPTRADDVKAGRFSGHRRFGLYIGEHDGTLSASG